MENHLWKKKVTDKNGQWYCIYVCYIWSVKSMSWYIYIWKCTFTIRSNHTRYCIQYNLGDTSSLWLWLACNKPHITFKHVSRHRLPRGKVRATGLTNDGSACNWHQLTASEYGGYWWFAPPKCQMQHTVFHQQYLLGKLLYHHLQRAWNKKMFLLVR